MSEEKQEQPQSNPTPNEEKPLPKEIMLKYDTEPIANLTRAINQKKDAEKEGNESSNTIGNRQISAQQEGNRIARIAIYVNGVLAALTIVALVLSVKAVNEASRAGDLADNSFRQYKRANDLAQQNILLAKESLDSNNRSSAAAFELSRHALGEQIQDFNEKKRQFQLENRPYLQISNMVVDTFNLKPNRFFSVTFWINDFGKQPAIIEDIRMKLEISKVGDYQDTSGTIDLRDLNGTFIPSENHCEGGIYFPRPITREEDISIITRQEHIFVIGQITYVNPISNTTRIYKFDISLYNFPGTEVRAVVNKDIPYVKEKPPHK